MRQFYLPSFSSYTRALSTKDTGILFCLHQLLQASEYISHLGLAQSGTVTHHRVLSGKYTCNSPIVISKIKTPSALVATNSSLHLGANDMVFISKIILTVICNHPTTYSTITGSKQSPMDQSLSSAQCCNPV
jgi:hypothetical protein